MSGTADFSVTLDEIPIKFSTVFKYLGDRLDNHLSFNELIDYVASKVSQKLGILSRVRRLLTTKSANRLYKSVVLPLLEYCDVAWHDCCLENQQKIERLQRRASRVVPKNSRELTSDDIIEKLGWKPLPDRREEHFKELVNNCFRGPDCSCLFKPGYFNTKRYDIHSHNTRFSQSLFVDKIKLQISKRAFYYKGGIL